MTSQQRLEVAPDSPFGLENLPYGVYSVSGGRDRIGVRYGDRAVDLAGVLGTDGADAVFDATVLNPFLAQGPRRWAEVRNRVRTALGAPVPSDAVHRVEQVTMRLPFEVTDYVDFYASEQHASNLGRLFRPDNPDPLLPNWRHLPVGYHGRSASIVVSGTDVVRPHGQRKGPSDPDPVFGPSSRLDIEAEVGFVVGVGNPAGTPIPVAEAEQHLFGVLLFNDWSARDIQAWEYVPLGPNLGKSFASTLSPWLVPMAALAAAKVPTPVQHPAVLPHLDLKQPWGLAIDLEVEWNGQVVSRPPYATTYWSPAQMLAHLTSNGAPTRPGDLFASGTVSGPEPDQVGSFIELSWGGTRPLTVAGSPRTFLEDGDTVTIRATAPGPGDTRIGFGEATGRIVASRGTE